MVTYDTIERMMKAQRQARDLALSVARNEIETELALAMAGPKAEWLEAVVKATKLFLPADLAWHGDSQVHDQRLLRRYKHHVVEQWYGYPIVFINTWDHPYAFRDEYIRQYWIGPDGRIWWTRWVTNLNGERLDHGERRAYIRVTQELHLSNEDRASVEEADPKG